MCINGYWSPKHYDDLLNSSRLYNVFLFFVTDVHDLLNSSRPRNKKEAYYEWEKLINWKDIEKTLFAWLIWHRPTVLLSQNKPAPATSQTNRLDISSLDATTPPAPATSVPFHSAARHNTSRVSICETKRCTLLIWTLVIKNQSYDVTTALHTSVCFVVCYIAYVRWGFEKISQGHQHVVLALANLVKILSRGWKSNQHPTISNLSALLLHHN
jgi:hypothetical protein